MLPYHLPDADRAERRTSGVLGEVVRLAVIGVPELLAPVDMPCEDQPATNITLASIFDCGPGLSGGEISLCLFSHRNLSVRVPVQFWYLVLPMRVELVRGGELQRGTGRGPAPQAKNIISFTGCDPGLVSVN